MSETKEKRAPLDIAKLRDLLGRTTPGDWSWETQHKDNCDEDEAQKAYVCHAGTHCDVTVVATMGTAEDVPLRQKQDDAAFISAAKNAMGELLDRLERAEAALQRADQFITNGIELGFIRMPDTDVPDSAHETPGIIKAALNPTGAHR